MRKQSEKASQARTKKEGGSKVVGKALNINRFLTDEIFKKDFFGENPIVRNIQERTLPDEPDIV
jgi:hypothetical protein